MMHHMEKIVFAFDRQTQRSRDADGRMRVRDCILSTAEVNPYRGKEIPKRDELGLDQNAIYELYRDPEELGAPETLASFQGIPLMLKHVPQTASEPRKEYQAGSVHSVRFDGKHLRGDLLVSDGLAIDLIEGEELSDLSCGYRYYPVMTAGKTKGGQSYDGRMTQIRGNHVALVDDGRASGAHVADSAFVDPRGPNPTMQGDSTMAFPENEPAAPQGGAAPAAAPQDGMAQLGALIKQLIDQNAQAHQAILAKLGAGAPAPAADPTAPPAGAPEAQDMNIEDRPAHQGPEGASDAEEGEAREEREEGEEHRESERAEDESEPATEPDGERDPQGAKPAPTGTGPRGGATPFGAMDARTVKATVAAAVDKAVKAERARSAAANIAKRDVAHILGGDIALDSASEIYREALVQVGVDTNAVPRGAEKAAWQGYKASAARVAGVLPGAQGSMALDSKPATAARDATVAHLSKIKVRG